MTLIRSRLLITLLTAAAAVASTSAARAQTPPAGPSCKAFVGQWVGTWQRNSQGKRWLHINEVSDQCVAKWAYLEEDREPKGWLTATIVDDVLTVPSRSMGGNVVYRMKGQEIWATYTSASGNSNNQAIFTRVAPAPK